MRTTPRKQRVARTDGAMRLPRHEDILGTLIRTPDPDTAEMLTHQLVHAPRNRRQARDAIRSMPKALRRRYGFGWDRTNRLVCAGNWAL